ncbi:19646_t:CDS:1, partial [Gigaspora rosea]
VAYKKENVKHPVYFLLDRLSGENSRSRNSGKEPPDLVDRLGLVN